MILPARRLCWRCYHLPSAKSFPLVMERQDWTERELANARELYQRGLSCAEIGWILKRTRHSVKEALRRARQREGRQGC
jgi:hypothetical protein